MVEPETEPRQFGSRDLTNSKPQNYAVKETAIKDSGCGAWRGRGAAGNGCHHKKFLFFYHVKPKRESWKRAGKAQN